MNEKNSLTEGEIMKALLKFAFPVFLSLFLQALYGGVDLLVVGPVALQDTLTGLAFLFIQTVINSFGLNASAGAGIAEKINSFIWLLPSALMQSVSVFVAQNLGAGRRDRVRKALRYGMTAAYGIENYRVSYSIQAFLNI